MTDHVKRAGRSGPETIEFDGRGGHLSLGTTCEDSAEVSVKAVRFDDGHRKVSLVVVAAGTTIGVDLHPETANGLSSDLSNAVARLEEQ